MMVKMPLALARLVVRIASGLAPSNRRSAMRAEWNAELVREAQNEGATSALWASLGAFQDALAMRGLAAGEGSPGLLADFRVAFRSLMRTPGFTAVSVLTLAIGLGSMAAVYTLLDRIVLDALPYPESDRLVRLQNQVPGVGPDAVWHLSTAQWVHFTDLSTTLDGLALFRGEGANVMTPSGPERVRAVRVTSSIFPLLGAEAQLGRLLTEADDDPSASPVIVLSDGLWRRAMGGDPEVLGQTLTLGTTQLEIVGVMAPGLDLPGWGRDRVDLWIPLQIDRNGSFGNSHVFPAVGRLAPGATPEAVEAEAGRLQTRLIENFPIAYGAEFFERYGFRTTATPLKEDIVGEVKATLWVLFGGVLLVLLVACANVTNLFLVRVEGRRRELSLRRVLGASRAALSRYILSESLILAVLGGGLAVVAGIWGIPALTRLAPEGLPRLENVALGWETGLVTLLTAVTVGILVALYPMMGRAAREGDLGSGGRGSSVGRDRQRVRGFLVVSQMALAITLLVGAGLLYESMRSLQNADAGFEAEGVATVQLFADASRYPDDVALWDLHRRVLEAVRAIPGVTEAGMGEGLPVSGLQGCTVQGFEDQIVYERMDDAGMTTCASQVRVTPGYFQALGVPLEAGRYLEPGDKDDPTRMAVVVSRAFADRFWPGEDPIGKGVGPSGRTVEPFHRVVGVVGDVARNSDDGAPPLSQTAIAIYYPGVHNADTEGWWGYWWPGAMDLVVKTEGVEPTSVLPAIRQVVGEIDPEIPLANAGVLSDVVDEATAGVSFLSTLMIVSALAALLLAAVGLYGVVSWVVSRRTREIGMRLAIGAAPAEVVRGVVGQTMRLAVAGLVFGLPLAFLTSRVGRSVLVGVEPTSPAAYVAAAGVVALVSALAAWIPARRAARIDPAESLRAE